MDPTCTCELPEYSSRQLQLIVTVPGGIEANESEMEGVGIVLIELVAVLAGRAPGHVDGVREPVGQQPPPQELRQLRLRAGGRPVDVRDEKSAIGVRRVLEGDELHLGGLGHDLEAD